MSIIEVVDYSSEWASTFEKLQLRILHSLQDIETTIEHVGSTSVPGLAAKPIIDMDIVADEGLVTTIIQRLARIGYRHRGNLGIEGREAFYAPAELPAHHLYVCEQGGLALANHLALRDYLRTHPYAVQEYGDLKKALAQQFPRDIDAYIEGKTDFILNVLEQSNFSSQSLGKIQTINQSSNSAK